MLFHSISIIVIHHALIQKVAASSQPNCLTTGDLITAGFKTCSDILLSGGSTTCCAEGDACLDTGLCFGNDGVLSRGACVNSFMTSTCLTFCDSVFSPPKQRIPCSAWVQENTTQHYWCGTNAEAICNSVNGSYIQFGPGKGNRIPGTEFKSESASSPAGSSSDLIVSSSTAILVAESPPSFTSMVELPTSTSSIEEPTTASEIPTATEETQRITLIPTLPNIIPNTLPNAYQLPGELPYDNPDEYPEEYFDSLQTQPEKKHNIKYRCVLLGVAVLVSLGVYLLKQQRKNRLGVRDVDQMYIGELEKLRYSPVQERFPGVEKTKGRGYHVV